MGVAAGVGHPDWQDVGNQVAAPFVNVFNFVATSVGAVVGTFTVQAWDLVTGEFETITNRADIRFFWFGGPPDNLGPNVVVRSYTVTGDDFAYIYEPVLAPTLRIEAFAAVNTNTNIILSTAMSRPWDETPAPDWGTLASEPGVTVGAGASSSEILIPYYGPAWVSLQSSATNWFSLIEARDLNGTVVARIWEQDSGAKRQDMIFLPRRDNVLRVTNNDAAARTFRWIVVAAG